MPTFKPLVDIRPFLLENILFFRKHWMSRNDVHSPTLQFHRHTRQMRQKKYIVKMVAMLSNLVMLASNCWAKSRAWTWCRGDRHR